MTAATWWDGRLLARWVAVNAVAYLVIVVVGVVLEELFSAPTRLAGWNVELATVVVALIGAGVHGYVLGRLQWRILRERLPRLSRRRWVVATFVPALAVWLLVLAPEAVETVTGGGRTVLVFRDAFVQALVLGPLIGLAQAVALRGHTRRWPWWFVANTTGYLFGAAMNEMGRAILDALAVRADLSTAFPVLAFLLHGLWMLWVTASPR